MIVILKRECADGKFDETVQALAKMSMVVDETDPNTGSVQGTICADKVDAIRKWPCVEYVRVDFTYIADYPQGDPRNKDQADASTVEDED